MITLLPIIMKHICLDSSALKTQASLLRTRRESSTKTQDEKTHSCLEGFCRKAAICSRECQKMQPKFRRQKAATTCICKSWQLHSKLTWLTTPHSVVPAIQYVHIHPSTHFLLIKFHHYGVYLSGPWIQQEHTLPSGYRKACTASNYTLSNHPSAFGW